MPTGDKKSGTLYYFGDTRARFVTLVVATRAEPKGKNTGRRHQNPSYLLPCHLLFQLVAPRNGNDQNHQGESAVLAVISKSPLAGGKTRASSLYVRNPAGERQPDVIVHHSVESSRCLQWVGRQNIGMGPSRFFADIKDIYRLTRWSGQHFRRKLSGVDI
jgi:hypothetical protein